MKIFTFTHVAISLAGILSGFVVLFGLIAAKHLEGWTRVFLATTLATSVSGFFFPVHGITPAIVAGIVSLLLLSAAVFARYARHLQRSWSKTYAISAVLALYLNVFVLVAQCFLHVPALKAIAPTQNDPLFKLAQLSVLLAFVIAGFFAAIRFRPDPLPVVLESKP